MVLGWLSGRNLSSGQTEIWSANGKILRFARNYSEVAGFEHLIFEFRVCFEFRNSIFEFIRCKLLLLVFFVLLLVACAVFLLETLYSPGRIDIFLLTCVKWMAHWADFCVYLFCRAAGLECIATAAVDYHFFILGMYLVFHNLNAPKYLKLRILTIFRPISTIILKLAIFPQKLTFPTQFACPLFRVPYTLRGCTLRTSASRHKCSTFPAWNN